MNKAQVRKSFPVQEAFLAPCHLSLPTTTFPSTFPPGNWPRLWGLKEWPKTSQAKDLILTTAGRRERREGRNWVAFGLSQIITLSPCRLSPEYKSLISLGLAHPLMNFSLFPEGLSGATPLAGVKQGVPGGGGSSLQSPPCFSCPSAPLGPSQGPRTP